MISTKELLRRIHGSELPPDENPLETIGLSPAILELGLSQDDLYEHCRRIARDLFARVHPDRHGGTVTPAVQKFAHSLHLISSRDVFDDALTHFREWYSHERANQKVLHARIHGLEADTTTLTRSLEAAREQLVALERARHTERIRNMQAEESLKRAFVAERAELDQRAQIGTWCLQHLFAQAFRFASAGNAFSFAERTELDVMSIGITTACDTPHMEAREHVVGLYREAVRRAGKKRRRDSPRGKTDQKDSAREKERALLKKDRRELREAILEHHLDIVTGERLLEYVKAARYATPALQWNFLCAAHASRMPRLMFKKRGTEYAVVRKADFKSKNRADAELYRRVLRRLLDTIKEVRVTRAAIAPERVVIDRQYLMGDSANKAPLFILGSVDLETALAHLQFPSHATASRLIVGQEIIPKMEPFAFPGKALVSTLAPQPLLLNPRNAEEWQRLLEQTRAITRKVDRSLFLSHVVLSVEH